ncbi:MAG TPA: hypothetical protein PLS12_01895 [Bacteroidales bacterium]|nr:hypothetical protein [Bacteroidales bacterium]
MVAGLTAAANDAPHNYVKIPSLNFKFSNPYLIGTEDAPLGEIISYENAKRLMNGTTSIITSGLPLIHSSAISTGQSIILDKLGSNKNAEKNNSNTSKVNTNSKDGSYKIQQGDNLTKIAKKIIQL